MGCTLFVARKSFFWLPLGVSLALGRIVYFAPSLGVPCLSVMSFNTAKNIYCLYWLKPPRNLKGFFLSNSMVRLEADIDSLLELFFLGRLP